MDDEASGRASPPARPTVTSPEEQPQLAQRAGCKAQGKNWKIRKYISPLTNYIFLQTYNGYKPKPVDWVQERELHQAADLLVPYCDQKGNYRTWAGQAGARQSAQ